MTRRWVEPAKSGNNGPLLSDNAVPKPLWLLNDTGRAGTFRCMKHIALILGVSLALITAPAVASAACVAEYKAKRDNPLQLNYGELTVSTCNLADATEEARSILAARGWILLKILSLKG
jgi:hypothetical protein